ncbi:MAG TPA: sigma factor-like helix-turn-helix DNA-binding protein [Solirubrobacteraceae bacterium]|nr:sigma factor-like helix-turn-helix DNA-binding protein [Solirubrobacteraceae bacterium]
MTSVDSLPADQRAVLELVLRRGRSYDEIAQLLSVDRAGVRQRALNALDALGPDTGLPAERRALITDYLLGALPPRVTDQVRERLATSPAERAWARVIAAELEPMASKPLPEIPAGGEAPVAAEEAGLGALAAEQAAADPEAPPARDRAERGRTGERPARAAREGGRGRRGRGRGRSKLGPTPPIEPGAERPASRRGGRVVLTAAAIIVLAIVLAAVLSNGGSKNTGNGSASTSSTLTNSSQTSSTSTTPATGGSKVLAQINLNPPSGGKAKGIAEVLREGGKNGLAIVATGLTPNTSHNAYAVWLYNSPSDSHLLGFVSPGVGSNGRLQTAGALPSNASHFHKLLVTLETKATPSSPGPTVLQGTLSGL